MNLLAVDTALGACSVAILGDDRVLAHRWLALPRGHAEALAPMVADAMRVAGLSFADIDRLAVTTGPGTFAGQRVGLAFMRGLRLALNRPLIGITTLEAMAAAARAETGCRWIAVLHEAKRGEVYGALYCDGRAVLPVQVAGFEAMTSEIVRAVPSGEVPALGGTATEAAADWFRDRAGRETRASAVRQPDALWVARLAQGAAEPAGPVRPLYLRAPDAKLPPPAIRFRHGGPRDAADLAALHSACFPAGWDAEFFERILEGPGGFAILAEAPDRPLGFVLARAAADEAEILAIGVRREHRRRGVGRRLLERAASAASERGAAKLFLEVAEDNEPAGKLYEALGFSPVGRRKAYYGGTGDARVLAVGLPLRITGLGNGARLAKSPG